MATPSAPTAAAAAAEAGTVGESHCALSRVSYPLVLSCILPKLSAYDLCQLCGVNSKYRMAFGECDAIWRSIARSDCTPSEYAQIEREIPKITLPPLEAVGTKSSVSTSAKTAPTKYYHQYWKQYYGETVRARDDRKTLLTHVAGAPSTRLYRVVVRGSARGVGVTSLIRRLTQDAFSIDTGPASSNPISVDRQTVYARGCSTELELWYV